MYDWMIDNGQTPYIVVDATMEGVAVPDQHVEDGKIILNIGPNATDQLRIDNDFLSFSARFHGAVEQVFVPPASVLGIYAKESGQGMIFTGEDAEPEPPPSDRPTPNLRVVK
jgi:stringent starvation protein B